MSENEKNTTPEEEATEATSTEATEADAPAETDEVEASADATEAEATEASEETAESATGADTRGMTVSHAIGVSRPEDRYASPGSDDARTREELEKLGVEPDSGGIDPVLLLSLVGVVVLTVAAWIFSMNLFEFAGKRQVETNFDRANYPMLAEITAESQALLTGYAELEGDDDGLYRVPVEVAFDILANDPSLLAAHPAGAPVERPLPEGLAAPTLRTPPTPPTGERPTLQLGTPTNEIQLDLGIQGSAGAIPIGTTNQLQVPTGGTVQIVDGTPTTTGTEPVIVDGAGVDSAGNPVEGTNAPPADDPTANPIIDSAGTAPNGTDGTNP